MVKNHPIPMDSIMVTRVAMVTAENEYCTTYLLEMTSVLRGGYTSGLHRVSIDQE